MRIQLLLHVIPSESNNSFFILTADMLVQLRACGSRVPLSALPLAHVLSMGPGHVLYKVSLWEGFFYFPNLMFLLRIAGALARMEQNSTCLKTGIWIVHY